MDTTTPTEQPTQPPRRASLARRLRPLWIAAGVVLFILASRSFFDGVVVFADVRQSSCQGGYCVERVHYPDLLLTAGRDEVHLRHDANGPQGRMYVEADPFDDYTDVTITWNADGAPSLSDGTATLTWNAAVLPRLND